MINSVTGSELPAPASVDREIKKTLGQEDFMRLLVAQLQYQDPLKPMEHTEFISQLSQFSSLDHLADINSGLKNLSDTQKDMNNKQAVDLIGKELKASGNRLYSDGGNESTGIGYRLIDDATDTVIRVFNSDGKVVRSIYMGAENAGYHTTSWDGKDDSGNIMPAGEYSFHISAKDAKGNELSTSSNVLGVADGVSFDGAVPYIKINGMKVPLSDIEEVNEVNRQ